MIEEDARTPSSQGRQSFYQGTMHEVKPASETARCLPMRKPTGMTVMEAMESVGSMIVFGGFFVVAVCNALKPNVVPSIAIGYTELVASEFKEGEWFFKDLLVFST